MKAASRATYNKQLFLWALAVLQPATANETLSFLKIIYPDIKAWPTLDELNNLFEGWLSQGVIYRTSKKDELFSITTNANYLMGRELRHQRDKARITLLRAAYGASLKRSEGVRQDLDGDSPSSEARTITQEGARPVSSGSAPSLSTRVRARTYWPRVAEQLNFKVGLENHSSDKSYRYCSFPTLKAVKEASGEFEKIKDMSITQLGLCIGVSPRLLTSLIHKPENHYRVFRIGKKGGGEREIASPRFFLKTIQYWIKSYFLCYLKIHPSCHAYTLGRSIITNAEPHVGKKFVANIDIENFFGSITQKHVFDLLREHQIGESLASAIARLVVFKGSIPQGAPTSPVISNAFLFRLDKLLTMLSMKAGLTYTRYADDITISGNSHTAIIYMIGICSRRLQKYGLHLKDKKTRIASNNASQKVTGIVVNEKIQPPKTYRKKVRAMFHAAKNNPELHLEKIDILRGSLSYLSAFENLKDSPELRGYRLVLLKLKAMKINNGKN